MPKKLDTKTFIEHAMKKHNGKYSYEKTVVVDRNKPVIITCPEHGDFLQTPRDHIGGRGCHECAKRGAREAKQKDTAYFINKAKKIHGDKYDYSKVKYTKAKEKVTIICPIHGEFQQSPCTHLGGAGCPHCKAELRKERAKWTEEDFMKLAKEKYADSIDFSKTKFVSSSTPTTFICKKHNLEFSRTPSQLIYKYGCPKCGKERIGQVYKKSYQQFLEEAKAVHGDEYTYYEDSYTKGSGKVKMKCNKCGNVFEQGVYLHINGGGCPQCYGNVPYTNESFIEKANGIHHGEYDYSQVKYVNSHTPIDIICPKHGVFQQKPYRHLVGQGCPECQQSRLEASIKYPLQDFSIDYEMEKSFPELGTYRYDYYIPSKKILIECQGEQHFLPISFFDKAYTLEDRIGNDYKKWKYAKDNDYTLLYLMPVSEVPWSDEKFRGMYTEDNIFYSANEMFEYIKNVKDVE